MATANTFVQIGSTVTVGSGGANTIAFSSIPATYTDLVIKMSGRTNNTASGAWDNIAITFNGASTNYSQTILYNLDGTAGSSSNATTSLQFFYANRVDSTSSVFSNCEIYIPNYAGSNYKSASYDSAVENNSTTSYGLTMTAGLWSNTAAITSITLSALSWNFIQYSTASLYGILKY